MCYKTFIVYLIRFTGIVVGKSNEPFVLGMLMNKYTTYSMLHPFVIYFLTLGIGI